MEPKGKYNLDFLKGKATRDEAMNQLNEYLRENGSGMHFEPVQPNTIVKTVQEKLKDHRLRNFKTTQPEGHGMALLYFLVNEKLNRRVFVNFIMKTTRTFHMKKPNDVGMEVWLELLEKEGCVNIVVDARRDKYKFSHLISMKTTRSFYHYLSTIKKNRTRIEFYIPIKKIVCKPLNSETLFDSLTFKDELQNLFTV